MSFEKLYKVVSIAYSNLLNKKALDGKDLLRQTKNTGQGIPK